MAIIAYTSPQVVGQASTESFRYQTYPILTNAAFRRMDFVNLQTVGSITAPPGNGSGSLAGVAGPAASAVTLSYSTSAGAPAQSFYVIVTYTGSSAESQASQEFVIAVPAGNVPTVTVASAGAPSGATGFNSYISTLAGFEAKQNASPTSLGSTYTAASPLTNYTGINRVPVGTSTGILGLVNHDSNAIYYTDPAQVGNSSLFGVDVSVPPLELTDQYLAYVTKISGIFVEANLPATTQYYDSLLGASVGLNYSSTGFYYFDPAQTAVGTIQRLAGGPPSVTGGVGDFGARVIVQFNTGAIA